ncbi:MAG: hypothetical protein M9894_17210 [Planctomycetes bacterium]|nr:hypothetical protein [Planctomycetota bacterium]
MSRRGHTLLEVVIASAAVAALALAVASLSLALRRSYVESTIRVDMDEDARRVLTALRRELRQSGYGLDGAPMLAVPSPAEVTFRTRTGLDTWSEQVTYRRVTDTPLSGGVPRWRLVRLVGPAATPVATTEVARGIGDLSFTLPAGGATVLVRLELVRANPTWPGASPPPPLRQVYEDQVELLNRPRSPWGS